MSEVKPISDADLGDLIQGLALAENILQITGERAMIDPRDLRAVFARLRCRLVPEDADE